MRRAKSAWGVVFVKTSASPPSGYDGDRIATYLIEPMFEPMFDLALLTLAMMVVATALLALERMRPTGNCRRRLGGTGARS